MTKKESLAQENKEDAGDFDADIQILEKKLARQQQAARTVCKDCRHSKFFHYQGGVCNFHLGPDYCKCKEHQ